jgi:DNA polymerase III epsilon subunit-like protein
MNFIVFDLEFNQDFSSYKEILRNKSLYPFEIIQIGAVKLDSNFELIETFNKYIKPTMYSNISSFITELTGITNDTLKNEKKFHEVFESFVKFIGTDDAILCTWGLSDVKELYKNAEFYELNIDLLPKLFINIQPYFSKYIGLSSKKLVKLRTAVEFLNIDIEDDFHNALNDALYTAEILKRIYSPLIHPKVYNPNFNRSLQPTKKEKIDYEGLFKQFYKMYGRDMSEEEKQIIKLAYLMGKTRQFIK